MSSVTTLATELFIARYLTVFGYIVLLWDSLLILPDEIERVWKTRITVPKVAYLANHYGTIAVITLLIYVFSGIGQPNLNPQLCVTATSVGLAGGVVSLGVGNYLVLLQVWQLWEQRTIIRYALTFGWAIFYGTTLVIALLVITQLPPFVIVVPGFDICAFSATPELIRVIWLSPILFEILVFALTVLNAFDRPRAANQSLLMSLYRDGLLYFVSLAAMRAFNFVVTIIAPTPFISAGACLIWEINTVLLNRLILNQRISLPVTDNGAEIEAQFDFKHTDVEMQPQPKSPDTPYSADSKNTQRSLLPIEPTSFENFFDELDDEIQKDRRFGRSRR